MLLSAPGKVMEFVNDQQKSAWSEHLSGEIDKAINGIKACANTSQYVNPAVVDVTAFQHTAIHWPGFPKLLYSQLHNMQAAYVAADAPTSVNGNSFTGGRALQDEYLEWFIHRDQQGSIRAVDFTTETLEYWSFLFSMDKNLAASGYSRILGTQVNVADISKASGEYNPFNRFNTTLGIVHLIQRNNTLPAELDIAVQATLPRTGGAGTVSTDVVSCTHCGSNDPTDTLGEVGRNSDPTIAQMVNAVAATGSFLTIPDPVGLYIQGLDLAGWTGPKGVTVSDCWKIVRGTPSVRATFTVPDGFKLSDFAISGKSIEYAGQIAEKISVFLTAAFGPRNAVALPVPRPCSGAHHAAVAPRANIERMLTRKAAIL